jgi:hypothetical protein
MQKYRAAKWGHTPARAEARNRRIIHAHVVHPHPFPVSPGEVSKRACGFSLFLSTMASTRWRQVNYFVVPCMCEWDFKIYRNFYLGQAQISNTTIIHSTIVKYKVSIIILHSDYSSAVTKALQRKSLPSWTAGNDEDLCGRERCHPSARDLRR